VLLLSPPESLVIPVLASRPLGGRPLMGMLARFMTQSTLRVG